MIVNVCLIIIATCELVRAYQNFLQLLMFRNNEKDRKNLNNKFISSLKKDNREWVADMLKEYEKTKEDTDD